MYESFCSHCRQEYPQYEIIFGVSDSHDPAIEIVDQLKAEFPRMDIRLLVCAKRLGTNIKVSNLAQMVAVARYDCLLVNDSDIRVPPDYLKRVIAPLADPKVGLVTCLYRGVAGKTLGSRLEALGISTDFAGGVLAAQELEGGVRFGLGSTLAFRRRDVDAIGGFPSLVEYLADDYELGVRIASRELRVELSEVIVDTFLPPYSLTGFLSHQLRWARGVRDSRRWGYFGLILTFGIPWGILTVLLAKAAPWALILLACALAARLTMAMVVGSRVMQDRRVIPRLWLIPLRDLVALFVWIASYAGHKVRWRGDYFVLKSGRLQKIDS